MKLGIVLIAVGVVDITLSLVLGMINAFAFVRFVIDIWLIVIGSRRIRNVRLATVAKDKE